MMNETEKMKQARWDLQLLSSSDPAATTNMLRYAAALAILLTGRRQTDRAPLEPQIASMFQFGKGEREFCMGVTWRTGVDQIVLAFDIDDAAGPPVGLGVIRAEGEEIACYGLCRLWVPANEGRALIVPAGAQDFGHFAFRRGERLRHLAWRPARDLEAGLRRGAARLMRLAKSDELRHVAHEGYRHVVRSEAGVLSTTAERLAA